MNYKKPLATSFGIKVALPAAAAALVIAYLLYSVINGLLFEFGQSDNYFARRAAVALQSQVKESFESVVIDNTSWDDAAENTEGDAAGEWFRDNWGTYTTGESYDAAVLFDRSARVLLAYRGGIATTETVQVITGFTATELAEKFKAIGHSLAPDFNISQGSSGYLLTAVAPILMSDGNVPKSGLNRFVVFTRLLSPEYLLTKGNQLGLRNLAIAAGPVDGKSSMPIIESGSSVIGYWTWDSRSKAAEIGSRYSRIVWAILGSLFFVIAILVNMSWKGFREAHEIKRQAIASALRDDLTGLPNRRQVIELLNEHLSKPSSPENGLSLIFADLDGFKEVNDAYGHEIGDQLLKSAAGGFEFLAAGRGVVARLGGDEFCIILAGKNAAGDGREIAQNMRRFLAEPIVFGGRVASVSVSVGIADRQPDCGNLDAEEFLRRADTAMYAAKSGGRNAIQIYDPSLDNKREEKRRISRELRVHLDNSAMRVVYQPIIDARDRSVAGVEALLRWPSDTARTLPPDVFIPVAEEFGMIEEIGYFVMLEACRQAMQWPDLFMSVNVSPLQFMNPSFADTVQRILNKTGLEPQRLEIEVTEGLIIDNTERVAGILQRLHNSGVSVALDDFGTGFSSIGQLRRFRFDKLKLDRSMVRDILHQPSALRLVQGTIAMADALGLKVTAEGIEDENQVSVLRLAGCTQFQGYLFSRPVDARLISAMLEPARLAQAS